MNSSCILQANKSREDAMNRIVDALMNLPMESSWRVTWEQAKSERSLRQNKYLFGCVYELISKEHGYEKMDLHEDFLKRHFGVRLKKVPRSREYPDGLKEVPIRTTTTDEHGRRAVLGKMQFAQFVEFVQRYSAENYGVFIPNPDPYWKDHRKAA